MTDAPRRFIVSMTDGTTKKIKAHKMQRDGSGTRLFDDEGEMIASWQDGQVKDCMREDLIEE